MGSDKIRISIKSLEKHHNQWVSGSSGLGQGFGDLSRVDRKSILDYEIVIIDGEFFETRQVVQFCPVDGSKERERRGVGLVGPS